MHSSYRKPGRQCRSQARLGSRVKFDAVTRDGVQETLIMRQATVSALKTVIPVIFIIALKNHIRKASIFAY